MATAQLASEHPRPTWSGTLRIGMAEIPLKLAPAAQELAINLRMTCPQDGEPVEQVYVCSEHPEEHHHLDRGPRNPQAEHSEFKCDRAYETPDGQLYPITYQELQSLKSDDGQVIDIIESRSAYSLDLAYVKCAYRAWTEPAHEKLVASLWRALDRQQLVAIGRMVMSKRVYMVALRAVPHKGLLVLRLNWQDEVRPAFPATPTKAEPALTKVLTEFLNAVYVKADEPMADDIRNEKDDKLRAIIRDKAGVEAVRTLAASVEFNGTE